MGRTSPGLSGAFPKIGGASICNRLQLPKMGRASFCNRLQDPKWVELPFATGCNYPKRVRLPFAAVRKNAIFPPSLPYISLDFSPDCS